MIGALLAGGAGRRLGAAGRGKASQPLAGRPLATYPAAVLGTVCERVVVVCKADTKLPELPGVERWNEPDEPRHPLTGIVHALERVGAPVLVCAVDLPLITAEACRSLLSVAARSAAPATVAFAGGMVQPVLGVYDPASLPALRDADPGAPLTETVLSLRPTRVALPERLVRSVNTQADLDAAEIAVRRG
jgi:molybdopterin-guanine dinucleotide biosynthesis protein A